MSCRSTSVTPKIPAKTSTLNSSDLQNSTASSGSHILDTTPDTPLTSTRVETAEVHSDSSMSGSRSLGSPKLDSSRKAESGAEDRVAATPDSGDNLEADLESRIQPAKRGAANNFVSSPVDSNTVTAITVDTVVKDSDDQVLMSANQNANDSDASSNPCELVPIPTSPSLPPLGETDWEGANVVGQVTGDNGEHGRLEKSLSKDSASLYYENVENLQRANIPPESKDYDEVAELDVLSELASPTDPKSVISCDLGDRSGEITNVPQGLVQDSPNKTDQGEGFIGNNSNSVSRISDDDVYVNIVAIGPVDNDYVSLSTDEEKAPGAGDTCSSSRSGADGEKSDGESGVRDFVVGSESAGLENSEDLIEDITYVLHRRHLEPNSTCKSETALIKGDSLPRRRDKSPSVGPSEEKRHSRRSRSPRSRSPRSRSPSAHRKCEIVHPGKLPPKDSYSSVDDSTSPSLEKEILEHIRKKQFEDKKQMNSPDIIVSPTEPVVEEKHRIVAPVPQVERAAPIGIPQNPSFIDDNGNKIIGITMPLVKGNDSETNEIKVANILASEKGSSVDSNPPKNVSSAQLDLDLATGVPAVTDPDDLSPAAALLSSDQELYAKQFERSSVTFTTFKPPEEGSVPDSGGTMARENSPDIPFIDDDVKAEERQVAEAIVQQVFAMVAKQLSTISEESDSSSLTDAPLAKEDSLESSSSPYRQLTGQPLSKRDSNSSLQSDTMVVDSSTKRGSLQSDLSSPSRKLSLYDDDSSMADSQGYDENFDSQDMLETLEHIHELSEMNRDFESSIKITGSSSFTSDTFSDEPAGRSSRASEQGQLASPAEALQTPGTFPLSSSGEDFPVVQNEIQDGALSDSSSSSETVGFRRGPRLSVDPLEQLERLAVSGGDQFSEESDNERDVTVMRNGHIGSSSESDSFPPPPPAHSVSVESSFPPPPEDLLHLAPSFDDESNLENMDMTSDSGADSDTESEGSVDLEKVLELQGLPQPHSDQNAYLSDEDLIEPSEPEVVMKTTDEHSPDNRFIGSPELQNANKPDADSLSHQTSVGAGRSRDRTPQNYADSTSRHESEDSPKGSVSGS